ncbi:hypothetical protein LEP1GSC151_1018 [Leptospira interrogans serovar Grippotyphosa str. LT2186]|uniref:Uncharacterized protein n=1 Tax=Leptospira interrogans serovar Grippotyphosa str. LT2186 TaxID=1001599 RepID=M3HAN3_LEPIR|nr:hypothetical protein LEP1GSC097_3534 [Leptospira interrogans serovar Grippotyphosa str. UI 08368]EMG09770.1 hypothetical protein LEP1GSC151_1018 [Leptospira interrogans serovar Grippotyphosa str. LT2186]EMN85975.1 hypothetical protein LEP1GSC107_3138 [Leptospira interrogans serovar Grippotyphosa str. UI 12769]
MGFNFFASELALSYSGILLVTSPKQHFISNNFGNCNHFGLRVITKIPIYLKFDL